MTESREELDETATAELQAPAEPDEPVKPPERIRREEWFLMPWRLLLLAATVWAGVYAWIGLTWPEERLTDLAIDTVHGSMQKGVVVFLGAQLLYYLYISSSFRKCREWGMVIWWIGLAMVILNLRANI